MAINQQRSQLPNSYVHLDESVRIDVSEFEYLSRRISKYQISHEDFRLLYRYVRSQDELYRSPWIFAPWVMPTWHEEDLILKNVNEYMQKERGTYRAWAVVKVERFPSLEIAKKATEYFYSSDTNFQADFKPLPYLYFFAGHIVCLKQN